MPKFVPICGPFSADTVYDGNEIVARDVGVTLPEVAAVTFDIQAMGNMTLPDWSRIEHMETAITKIGVDKGLATMTKPGAKNLEFRGVYPVADASGNTKQTCHFLYQTTEKALDGKEKKDNEQCNIEDIDLEHGQ